MPSTPSTPRCVAQSTAIIRFASSMRGSWNKPSRYSSFHCNTQVANFLVRRGLNGVCVLDGGFSAIRHEASILDCHF